MIKEFSIAALTALNMNISDATISDYNDATNAIKTEEIKALAKPKSIYLSPEKKAEIQKLAQETLETWILFEQANKNLLLNHFDDWIVTESDKLCTIVDNVIEEFKFSIHFFSKISKQYKNYPSISRKVDEVIVISNSVFRFTVPYKKRTDAAKDTLKFLKDFIPKNEEVLRALG